MQKNSVSRKNIMPKADLPFKLGNYFCGEKKKLI